MSDHEATEPEPDERGAADEPDEVSRESAGNPWAKTSSGDADELVSDDEDEPA